MGRAAVGGLLVGLAVGLPAAPALAQSTLQAPPGTLGAVWVEWKSPLTLSPRTGGVSELVGLKLLRPDRRGTVRLPARVRLSTPFGRYEVWVFFYGAEGCAHWRDEDRSPLCRPDRLIEEFFRTVGDNVPAKLRPEVSPIAADLRGLAAEQLADPDTPAHTRRLVEQDLGRLAALSPPDDLARVGVQALTKALKDASPGARWPAALALRSRGAAVVPPLTGLVKDPDPGARAAAVAALWGIGPEAKAAVPALVDALKDPEARVRRYAAHTLGRIGPEARGAIPALVGAMQDREPGVRSAAVRGLGGIGPDAAAAAIPALLPGLQRAARSLRGEPTGVRATLRWEPGDVSRWEESQQDLFDATQALGGLGPAALPALVELLRNPTTNEIVAARVAEGIGVMGPTGKDAVPALIDALRDPAPEVRGAAAWALGRIGPAARDPVPPLVATLKDPHPDVRRYAAGALARIGPSHPDVLPALTGALQDPEPFVRHNVLEALASLGEAAAPAFPAMVEALTPALYSYGRERVDAVRRRMGKAAVPALIASLKHPDYEVRMFAAESLGLLGPDARDAVPALTEALKDLRSVADKAEQALQKIRGR